MTRTSVLLLALSLTLAGACGRGGSPAPGDSDLANDAGSSRSSEIPLGDSASYTGVIVTRDLTIGPNRFSVGVIDIAENQPIQGADVSLRFFKLLEGDQAQLRFESDASEVVMDRSYVDNKTGQQVGSGQIAVYVADPDFDEEGDWGVEINGTVDEATIGPILLVFDVRSPDTVLSVGDPAPRSRQQIASDVEDLALIDTMQPHDPMHDVTIEDAVASGRPTVILFGTPAFCETLTCGPVMQSVMLPLYEQYKDRANFIHVEPYLVPEARSGQGLCSVPAFNLQLARAGIADGPGVCPILPEDELQAVGESWNLTAEPVIFVIDSRGVISGKFEAVTGLDEVERVLDSAM